MTKKGHRQLSPEKVAEALIEGKGIVSLAAKILKCSRQSIYVYLEKHESVRMAQESADSDIDDFAEVKLIEKIRDGNLKAIMFRLETKGKKRGYVRRHEMSGPGGGAIPSEITLTFDR